MRARGLTIVNRDVKTDGVIEFSYIEAGLERPEPNWTIPDVSELRLRNLLIYSCQQGLWCRVKAISVPSSTNFLL